MAAPAAGPGRGSADPYPEDLVREAVARGGGRCSVCGRPCGERGAWRHTEPGPLGDSAANFSPMCIKCSLFLSRGGARPARYVVHLYGSSKARARLRWLLDEGLVVLVAVTYLIFVSFACLIMYWTPRNPFMVVGCGILVFYLAYLGVAYISGLREAWLARTASSGFPPFRDRTTTTERQP